MEPSTRSTFTLSIQRLYWIRRRARRHTVRHGAAPFRQTGGTSQRRSVRNAALLRNNNPEQSVPALPADIQLKRFMAPITQRDG